jgi:lyso-ornithine lipid O-acyltransferase
MNFTTTDSRAAGPRLSSERLPAFGRRVWRGSRFAANLLRASLGSWSTGRTQSLADRARWLQTTSRAVLRTLGVQVHANGPAPVASVIVANHISYLDILVIAATTPVIFVAKREVSRWPVFGLLARLAGTRFIDREKRADVVRVGAELEAVLKAGVSVVLFLEGTSTDGRSVKPFKTSLLEPVVQAGWTTVSTALLYAVPPGHSAEQEVCWWGDMTLMPHLWNLLGVPQIDAHLSWDAGERAASDRKTFGERLHYRVAALHAALESASSRRSPHEEQNAFHERLATTRI